MKSKLEALRCSYIEKNEEYNRMDRGINSFTVYEMYVDFTEFKENNTILNSMSDDDFVSLLKLFFSEKDFFENNICMNGYINSYFDAIGTEHYNNFFENFYFVFGNKNILNKFKEFALECLGNVEQFKNFDLCSDSAILYSEDGSIIAETYNFFDENFNKCYKGKISGLNLEDTLTSVLSDISLSLLADDYHKSFEKLQEVDKGLEEIGLSSEFGFFTYENDMCRSCYLEEHYFDSNFFVDGDWVRIYNSSNDIDENIDIAFHQDRNLTLDRITAFIKDLCLIKPTNNDEIEEIGKKYFDKENIIRFSRETLERIYGKSKV